MQRKFSTKFIYFLQGVHQNCPQLFYFLSFLSFLTRFDIPSQSIITFIINHDVRYGFFRHANISVLEETFRFKLFIGVVLSGLKSIVNSVYVFLCWHSSTVSDMERRLLQPGGAILHLDCFLKLVRPASEIDRKCQREKNEPDLVKY